MSDNKNIAIQPDKTIQIDILDMYQSKEKNYELNIVDVRYSNEQFMQVTDKDICIDFLELPGFKKDDKIKINAVRVYMTHQSAKNMIDTISKLISNMQITEK